MDPVLLRNFQGKSVVKKVAIVLNSAWQAYNFRLNLARGMKENGYEVVFIAPDDANYSKKIQEEFDFYNISIDAKGINPVEDLKVLFSLYKLYKNIKPDIVLNFTIKPNIYSAIVAKLLGIKSINNITGLGTVFIKKSIITTIAKLLYKISLSSASKVFFQNTDDKNLFIKEKLVQEEKTDLIPGSGVDTKKFSPVEYINNDIFKFLMVARVLRDKGVYEYIQAIKILKQKYDNLEFQLLGEVGVENKTAVSKEELYSWIDEGIINYLGSTDNVKSFLSKVDCVLLPSYREGTPRSLLEAASMAKPIVTTNVVGCKEVVEDGLNGFLCEVKNAKDLALKMQKIIELPKDERKSMGQRGREKIINEFDEKIVIDKYLQTISELL